MAVRDLHRRKLEQLARELTSYTLSELGPHVGVTFFVFDTEAGGDIAYVSSVEREGMIRSIEEWLAKQHAGLMTDPPGERIEG